MSQFLQYDSKWIAFHVIERKPKTLVWEVVTKDEVIESGVTPHPVSLGVIKFYPNWRQYAFFPSEDHPTVFEKTCLQDITNFLIKANKEMREIQKASKKQQFPNEVEHQ